TATPPAFASPDPALATYADAVVLSEVVHRGGADLALFPPADQALLQGIDAGLATIVADGPAQSDATDVSTLLGDAVPTLAGLAHCRAPLVARMDADDLMHRDRLAAQIAALRADPGLVAVGCHVRLFPRAGLTEGLRAYERWLNGIDSAERLRAEAFVECPL